MPAHKKSSFNAILDRAIDTTAIIGFTGLVIIAFMTLIDVTMRYLGFPRIPGLHDIEEVAYAIVIASCFPAGLRKSNAVTVRVLGKLLGPRAHSWLDVIGAFFMLTFFTLLAWQFAVLAVDYSANGRTTSTLEWSVGPIWTLATLLMIACVGVQAWMLGATIRATGEGQPLEHEAESL